MRGYGVATLAGGKLVKSVDDIAVGDNFQLRLADGEISAVRDK